MLRTFKILLVVVFFLSLSVSAQAKDKATASGFVFEITNSEGVVTTIIQGSSADFREGGIMRLIDVHVTLKGETDTVIETPAAFYDRNQGTINSYEAISLSSDSMTMTGDGAKWYSETGVIYVKKNANILLNPKDSDPTKVTCTGVLKIEKGVAHLEKDVVIDSATSRIEGDAAVIYFDSDADGGVGAIKQMDVAGENMSIVSDTTDIRGKSGQFVFSETVNEKGSRDIEKMTITEDVIIMFEDKLATGQKAEYTASDDLLVLSGYPKIKEGNSTYAAEKIKIYPSKDVVEFEPQAELIVEG